MGKLTGHVVEVVPSTERVRVLVGGQVIAETGAPLVVRETGYPDRYYLPREDVLRDVIAPSAKASHCPFKGDASYVDVEAGGTRVPNAAWSYVEPIDAVAPIAGHLSFYPSDTVTVEVDGRSL